MEIILEKSKMHVIDALPTEEKKINRLIEPLAQWVSAHYFVMLSVSSTPCKLVYLLIQRF